MLRRRRRLEIIVSAEREGRRTDGRQTVSVRALKQSSSSSSFSSSSPQSVVMCRCNRVSGAGGRN